MSRTSLRAPQEPFGILAEPAFRDWTMLVHANAEAFEAKAHQVRFGAQSLAEGRAELRAVQGNRVVRIDERLRNSARKGALKKLVIACSTLPHADVITML